MWSPDGTEIVFFSNREGNFDLWTIPVNGGAATRLTSDPAHEDEPSWSPNDAVIAFNRGAHGSRDVWLLVLDGGEEQQFTADDETGAWAPDGRTLAFHSDRTGVYNIWVDQTTVPVKRGTWGALKARYR